MLKYIILLMITSSVYAFSSTNNSFTLDELIQTALEQSKLISAQNYFIEAEKKEKKQMLQGLNPEISLGADYSSGESGVPGFEVGLSQAFYFPGKQNLNFESKEVDEKIAQIKLEENKLEIRYEVIRLSYLYNLTSVKLKHFNEWRERYELLKTSIAARPGISPASKAAQQIVQSKINAINKDIVRQDYLLKSIWESLNQFVKSDQPITIKLSYFTSGIELKKESLFNDMQKSNPLLKTAGLNIVKNEKELAKIRFENLPDFGLSAVYRKEPLTDMYIGAGISIPLPVWNQKTDLQKSYLNKTEAEKSVLSHYQNMLEHKLNSMLFEYEGARKTLNLYPLAMIDDIHSKVKYFDEEFIKGRLDLLTYLELSEQFFETHSAVYDTQYDYVDKYTEILKLSASTNFIVD